MAMCTPAQKPRGPAEKKVALIHTLCYTRSRRTVAISHIVAGEVMLVAIPFTRLSHMIFAPFTRAYMGSEFGKIRHAADW